MIQGITQAITVRAHEQPFAQWPGSVADKASLLREIGSSAARQPRLLAGSRHAHDDGRQALGPGASRDALRDLLPDRWQPAK